MKIKDIKNKSYYTQIVTKRLANYLLDFLYRPIKKMINQDIKAENDRHVILEALRNRTIIYKDGVFKAANKLSNELSLEFEKLGAKWNKSLHGYQFEELPEFIKNFIKIQETKSRIKINQINDYLDDLQYNLNHVVDTMIFNDDVNLILNDSQKQFKKNIKNLNIIEPKLTQEQKDNIANDYTNNMQYYIKKWTANRIVKMRQQVHQAILDGYREEYIVDMLKKEYNIEKNKAKFLAQNETSIMLAQLKKQMYQEMGFTEFIWNTIMDTRERQLHADLNGKIFRFDNPPIIDTRTGQRGLPGETYNCRCSLIPYKRDSVFDGITASNELVKPVAFKFNHKTKTFFPLFDNVIKITKGINRIANGLIISKKSKVILNKINKLSKTSKYKRIIDNLKYCNTNTDVANVLKVANTNFNYFKVRDDNYKSVTNKANDILNKIINNKIKIYGQIKIFNDNNRSVSKINAHAICLQDKYNEQKNICTILHEFMHIVELDNKNVLNNSLAFLEARTKNNPLKKLNEINNKYKDNEFYKHGNFPNEYCGKIYNSKGNVILASSSEIMSEGIQMLFKNPNRFIEKDKQYAVFVIANLHGDI